VRDASPGERIVVEAGIYRESVVIDKPVTIEASGAAGQTVIESAGAPALDIRAAGVEVLGLTVSKTGTGATYEQLCAILVRKDATLVARKCTVTNEADGGIWVQKGGRGTLDDCDVTGKFPYLAVQVNGEVALNGCRIHTGIMVLSSGSGSITDCTLRREGGNVLDMRQSGRVIVRGSRLGGGFDGIHMIDSPATFEDCGVTNNSYAGVEAAGGKSDVTIRRCTITGNEKWGVRAIRGARVTVEDSDLRDNKEGATSTAWFGKITGNRNREQ
jgi:F-box protein 11